MVWGGRDRSATAKDDNSQAVLAVDALANMGQPSTAAKNNSAKTVLAVDALANMEASDSPLGWAQTAGETEVVPLEDEMTNLAASQRLAPAPSHSSSATSAMFQDVQTLQRINTTVKAAPPSFCTAGDGLTVTNSWGKQRTTVTSRKQGTLKASCTCGTKSTAGGKKASTVAGHIPMAVAAMCTMITKKKSQGATDATVCGVVKTSLEQMDKYDTPETCELFCQEVLANDMAECNEETVDPAAEEEEAAPAAPPAVSSPVGTDSGCQRNGNPVLEATLCTRLKSKYGIKEKNAGAQYDDCKGFADAMLSDAGGFTETSDEACQSFCEKVKPTCN